MSPSFTVRDCPAELRDAVGLAVDKLRDHGELQTVVAADAAAAAGLERALVCSEYATAVVTRYPDLYVALVTSGRLHRPVAGGEYLAGLPAAELAALTEKEFMRALRRYRHRELLRIVVRDLAGWSDTGTTLAELSQLADACINAGLEYATALVAQRCGLPRDAAGNPNSLLVMAMGKLGGGELNFSSDIDLVFLYQGAGDTDGPRAISHHEFFQRVAQRFIQLLTQRTADGFVYRVDARLRPFGDSGPLVCSIGAFEDYLLQQGRDWERYAWVKARAVNAWPGAAELYSQILRPFVYRRYLDFGVFASLREMKAMIEREERAAENRDNIKLGPGGIREIEFIVQTLQLVRGGTLPELRERSLLTALAALGDAGLMPPATVAELRAAYCYLRDVENRLQFIADRQTHELPSDPLERARLTHAMGCASWDALYAKLNAHRQVVRQDFDRILHHEREGAPAPSAGAARGSWRQLAEQSFADPDTALDKVTTLCSSTLYQRMDEVGRQRLQRLIPALLVECGAQGARGLQALEGMLRIVESIGRRSAYVALLNENQPALARLVRLSASSEFLAKQVAAHPLLLDELLDSRIVQAVPARAEFQADLRQRVDAVAPDDSEQRFEAVRNFQQAAVFRVAVADLNGLLPLMKVSDRLTDIAELVLEEALRLAEYELSARHGQPYCVADGVRRRAGFGIAGYGKLGGLELGYGSDLDIVFLHDSTGTAEQTDGPQPLENPVYFARLARRITHILTMTTPTGPLYEVDTRLRPSGNSGLLVTSLTALDRYQREEAWTWEHQALLRARVVAGDTAVRDGFTALRATALVAYVRRDTLRAEVIKMRRRMRAELVTGGADEFDIKQGAGGLIDLEFLVQYLVLRHAPDCAALLEWTDNIRQLEALAVAGLLDAATAEALADAYRAYRQVMHVRALGGENRLVAAGEFRVERALVAAQWEKFLGAAVS
ncbi:MAG: bifunctional [glutamate--ammonia ligase]-adenylyl-L-tyrosine phosphorylase/[glutamate--ammonia-ligase] adenylyltransferase [Gammaproteobacteria bacterium]|jgi:glutamate-ammonia-ligase adenylyltransferase|nr:bifunctional [glutamate--ammonia ligase]-adenylyl-L-tyrosine phosphorylase/[glutamate--ammonia-ligase] adenylyltransferase [Gammaproteobacteria bacterium]